MWPDSAYAVPIGSFRVPVVIPDIDPDAAPLVTVCFNAAWLPYVLGCLKQLMLQATWQTTDPDVLNQVQGRAANLMYLFIQGCKLPESGAPGGGPDSEDRMWRQNPDNPCILETSVDGVCWCPVFDASKCYGQITQPGAGSGSRPQPGANEHQCLTLFANAQLLMGFVVYPGDTLNVVSASGAGNDGGTSVWYCTDGEQFFGGACIGFAHTDSGDPLPTANHMRLIWLIDGTAFDAMGGAITIGGSGPQQAILQVNDSALANNSGSYDVCVDLTAAAASGFTHTFDLTLNGGGFTADLDGGFTEASYLAGSGWHATTFGPLTGGAYYYTYLSITRTFATTTITSVDLYYDFHSGTDSDPAHNRVVIFNLDTTAVINLAGSLFPDGDGLVEHWVGSQSASTLNVQLGLARDTSPTPGGSGRVYKIVVSGIGTDPF